MATTRIVSSEPLTDAEATSWAPAVSRRLATSLGGRPRYLLELLRGDGAGFDGDVGTPLNPQGQLGVDRSGPPWGDAHLHPMWIYEHALDTNIAGQVAIASLTAVGQVATVFAEFFNRPHYVAPKVPYSRAYFRGRVTCVGGGSCTVQVRVYSGDVSRFASVTTTGTGTIGDSVTFADVVPGLNSVRIEFECTALTGTSARIDRASLNQIARRSH